MAEIRTHGAGGKAKLSELLERRKVGSGSCDEQMPRVLQVIRSTRGDSMAEHYTSLADDAALSELKREASMLFSAAEGLLEAGDTEECLRVAESAQAKFIALGDAGKDGVTDTLHIIIDVHRLEAYRGYRDPAEALSMADEYLRKFKKKGDRRGEATMKLALAEILTDNVRQGKRREALEPAMDALAIARDFGDKKLEAKCWIESAFVHFSLNDGEKVLEAAEAALAISEELGDDLGRAMALYAGALSHVRRRDWDGAVQRASAAQGLLEGLGKQSLAAGVLHTMAVWRLLQGRPKRAAPLAEQALGLLRQLDGSFWAQAAVTLTLCEALAEARSPKAALKAAREALERFEALGLRREQAVAQEALALGHLAAESPERAARSLEAARALAEDLGERRYEARLLLAAAAAARSDREEARGALERAAELAREEGDLPQLARAQRELAALLLRGAEGEEGPEAALAAAGEALATARRDGDQAAEAAAALQRGLCHALQEEHSKAITACGDAEDLYREVGALEGEAQALHLLAEVQALDGKLDSAVETARERLSLCQQLEDGKPQAGAMMLLASLSSRAGRHEEAERWCQEALLLAQQAEEPQLEVDVQLLLVQVYIERAQGARDTSIKQLLGKAAKASGDAVSAAARLGEKGPRGVALYWKAHALILQGRFQDAQRAAGEAEALFRNIQSEQGQGACLHLCGALHAVFGQADRAVDTLERALAFAQAAKDPNLEYEVSTSIFNVQRQLKPQQQMMAADRAQQMMMPGEAAEGAVLGEALSAAPPEPKGLDPAFVRRQLLTFVKDVVAGEEEIELDSPFMEAGMDSLSSVSLMSMVAKEFQMALSPSLVFDFPTVRALEDHLVEESKG